MISASHALKNKKVAVFYTNENFKADFWLFFTKDIATCHVGSIKIHGMIFLIWCVYNLVFVLAKFSMDNNKVTSHN